MKDINLIPKSYFDAKKKKKRKVYISIGIFMFCIVFILAFVIPIVKQKTYETHLKKITEKAEKTSGYIDKTNVLDEFHQIYNDRKDVASKIFTFNNNEIKLFKNIEDSRPENVFIMSYKMSGESKEERILILNCISDNEEEVITFIANLRENEFFNKISISSLNKMAKSNNKDESENETNGFSDKFTSTIELYY
ncbi:MAG: PilN domain-containing protein [Clostridiales bacterium]